MRSLALTAGVGIKDKLSVENRVQDSMHCVVNESITNGRLMDITRLLIVDLEGVVSAVMVGFVGEVIV